MVALLARRCGAAMSRASVSSTTPLASRIFMSTRTGPTGASKDAWLGTPGDDGWPAGPTPPSKRTVPSGADAVITTVDARGRGEVVDTDGNQVNMTVIRPVSAGTTPDQDWISALRRSTRIGADAGGESAARIASDIGAT